MIKLEIQNLIETIILFAIRPESTHLLEKTLYKITVNRDGPLKNRRLLTRLATVFGGHCNRPGTRKIQPLCRDRKYNLTTIQPYCYPRKKYSAPNWLEDRQPNNRYSSGFPRFSTQIDYQWHKSKNRFRSHFVRWQVLRYIFLLCKYNKPFCHS